MLGLLYNILYLMAWLNARATRLYLSYYVSCPLCTNSGTYLYPESTTLLTEIKATGVQLIPETYISLMAWLNATATRLYLI